MSERFLYEIRPNRPVVIPGKGKTVVPQRALLTKDEALDYMKYGPVYRCYAEANVPIVKVTGENINLLHAPYQNKQNNNTISVSDALKKVVHEISKDDEVVVETIKEEVPEPKKLNVEESIETVDDSIIDNNDIDQETETSEPNIEEIEVETINVNDDTDVENEVESEAKDENVDRGVDTEEEIVEEAKMDNIEPSPTNTNTNTRMMYNNQKSQYSKYAKNNGKKH